MNYRSLLAILILLLFIGWTVGVFLIGKNSAIVLSPKVTADTVVVKETVRDTVLIPQVRWVTRVDTVFLAVPGDTAKVKVEIPIERKIYQTENYRAMIEGFRPMLVEMEIYQQTQYITKTETIKIPDRRRWGLGIHVGYGYGFDKFHPYIGVGLQYTLFSW